VHPENSEETKTEEARTEEAELEILAYLEEMHFDGRTTYWVPLVPEMDRDAGHSASILERYTVCGWRTT
jgi:hypothetical protein